MAKFTELLKACGGCKSKDSKPPPPSVPEPTRSLFPSCSRHSGSGEIVPATESEPVEQAPLSSIELGTAGEGSSTVVDGDDGVLGEKERAKASDWGVSGMSFKALRDRVGLVFSRAKAGRNPFSGGDRDTQNPFSDILEDTPLLPPSSPVFSEEISQRRGRRATVPLALDLRPRSRSMLKRRFRQPKRERKEEEWRKNDRENGCKNGDENGTKKDGANDTKGEGSHIVEAGSEVFGPNDEDLEEFPRVRRQRDVSNASQRRRSTGSGRLVSGLSGLFSMSTTRPARGRLLQHDWGLFQLAEANAGANLR